MAFSSWLCSHNTKNMILKIVHPGGHIELHDRPIVAAEIMIRNPRCCVTYPHVFQQPWAIVPPHTTLMLGQKFYIVPISTVRKLQKLSHKHSPSTTHDGQGRRRIITTCWLFGNQNKKDGCLSDDNCFMFKLTGVKLKVNNQDSRDVKGSIGSSRSTKTKEVESKIIKEYTRRGKVGSPNRLSTFDNWQPRLEIIKEESID